MIRYEMFASAMAALVGDNVNYVTSMHTISLMNNDLQTFNNIDTPELQNEYDGIRNKISDAIRSKARKIDEEFKAKDLDKSIKVMMEDCSDYIKYMKSQDYYSSNPSLMCGFLPEGANDILFVEREHSELSSWLMNRMMNDSVENKQNTTVSYDKLVKIRNDYSMLGAKSSHGYKHIIIPHNLSKFKQIAYPGNPYDVVPQHYGDLIDTIFDTEFISPKEHEKIKNSNDINLLIIEGKFYALPIIATWQKSFLCLLLRNY